MTRCTAVANGNRQRLHQDTAFRAREIVLDTLLSAPRHVVQHTQRRR